MDDKSQRYNTIKKCVKTTKNNKIPHNSILNNLKSNKYFTFNENSDSKSMKKALTKYREKNNINNSVANKTYQSNISTTNDNTSIYQLKQKLHKNISFKLDKRILNFAEPRTKVKEFHKIQPKILDNEDMDNFLINENNKIINEKKNNNKNKIPKGNNKSFLNKTNKKENISINLNNIETNDNNNIINQFVDEDNSFYDIKIHNEKEQDVEKMIYNNNNKSNENKIFETEISGEKKDMNNILNINDINLQNIIILEKLHNELIKDLEINKMDGYANKLSIIKDFLFIYNSNNNDNLFNIIDNSILKNKYNNLSCANFTINKNKSFNMKELNSNDDILLIIKEYLIQQIIFLYIILLISLIKKEKNNYQSGLHNLSFYFHQNIIIFIYIIFKNFNFISKNNNDNDNDCYEKCIIILDENKTWLDKSNYKSYLQTNNKLSKQILLNLFTQLKLFFKKNHYKELNNIKIENSINLLKSFLNTFSKKKIINILKEINNSSEINYLLELTQIDKIACNYDGKNMLNEEENRIFNEQNLKIPFLKPISSKYKYTLVLDLDETLVHYISDIDSAYIQIRPGAEEFLKDLSKYYEIIIFTAALQTYADLVIDGIDPDGVISDRLYRQHTICIGNTNIKDLTKIGRDLKHVIIIDNFLENYSLQPQNGLNIMDFEGNEYDDELNYLKEDLIKLVKMNPDDVRNHLKDIQINMDKRAAYFQKLNEDNNYQNETLHGYNDEENNNLFSEIINQNNTASQNNEKNGYNDSDGSENIDN